MKRRVRLHLRLIPLAAALTFLFPKASPSFATESAAEEQYNQILLKHPQPRLHWATWRTIQAQQKGALSQLAAKLLITVDKGVTKSVAITQSTGFDAADADLVHWIETKWRFRPEITRRFTLPVYVINDAIFSSPHVIVTKARELVGADYRPETSRHFDHRVITLCRSKVQTGLNIFPL